MSFATLNYRVLFHFDPQLSLFLLEAKDFTFACLDLRVRSTMSKWMFFLLSLGTSLAAIGLKTTAQAE